MASVTYNVKFTRNMGNYESLQIGMGVEDEPRGDEKVSEAFNRVKNFVESQLFEAVDELETQVVTVRDQVRNDFRAWQAAQAGKK